MAPARRAHRAPHTVRARAGALDALAELVRRLAIEAPPLAHRGIGDPEAAAALFAHLRLLDAEELWVAYLNVKNIPLWVVRVGIGAVNEVAAYPSRIFREALVRGSSRIIVAHNHPSGDPTPSGSDRAVAERLRDAAELLGIDILDQLIVGRAGRTYCFSRKMELRAAILRRRSHPGTVTPCLSCDGSKEVGFASEPPLQPWPMGRTTWP